MNTTPRTAELRTSRLLLRGWQPTDREAFAALNADPEVMQYFPSVLTREQSDRLADRIEGRLQEQGWGLWAVEITSGRSFAGFVGLNPVTFEAPFAPAVEVGWRLARDHWGMGYATEAARAAVTYGFEVMRLREIVSFTSTDNFRSRRVMEKLGMQHLPLEDFDHPGIPEGHHLRRHVLYRLKRPQTG